MRGDRVLMCQRAATKIYPLHWEFPGGKVELGESLEEALARELMEELNIEIEEAEQFFFETASYDNGLTYDITYFLVWRFSPEPVNLEFNAIEWFSRDALKALKHLTGNERILAKLYREGFPR